MSKWCPIVCRDFYDVPHAVIVSSGSRNYYFLSTFDEGLDEYRDYEVYLMPVLFGADLSGSWMGIEQRAVQYLGRVPVKDVRFDATKRQEIDLEIMERLQLAVL